MCTSFLWRLLVGFCLNCLLIISLEGQERKNIQPLRLPVALSGNFGELRATHFHAGVDFRTGGVEGCPVLCVNEGYAVRVNVSPVGYGQALYVEHPDGTTTVYGHLQRYCPEVEKVVRELQYQKESFAIDENIKERKIYFKQGDTIAYSGNTGSSGGPHLHFEVRDTKSEKLINPLHYYNIKDIIAPSIKAICLYTISEIGNVKMIRQVPAKPVRSGYYTCGKVTIPAGEVGLSVFVEDYMNGSGNKLGIYSMVVSTDNDTVFSMKMDSLSFEQSYLINDVKDFWRYKKKETVYRCFGNYQAQMLGVKNKKKGVVELEKGEKILVSIEAGDINGNRAVTEITLIGGEYETRAEGREDVLAYNEAYTLELPECSVVLEPYSLPYSVKRKFKCEKDSVRDRIIYIVGEGDEPLMKKARLSINGTFSEKALICEVGAGSNVYPLPTFRGSAGIYCNIGYLGSYTVVEDRVAPEVSYLGAAGGRLKFKIRDGFSGIGSYRGEVNGKWCLFVYDAKSGILSCSIKEPAFLKGKANDVKLTIKDKVGNAQELKVRYVYP